MALLLSTSLYGYSQINAGTINSQSGGFTNWDKMASGKERELEYATRRADLAEQRLRESQEAIKEFNYYVNMLDKNGDTDILQTLYSLVRDPFNGDIRKFKMGSGFEYIDYLIKQKHQ